MSNDGRMLQDIVNIVLESLVDDSDENSCLAAVCQVLQQYNSQRNKMPCRTSALRGQQYVTELVRGNESRCYENLRMNPDAFENLCERLKGLGLSNSKWLTAQEQLAIFLLTLSHNARNRLVAERFQHSTWTIFTHFHRVLHVISILATEIIVPPNFNVVPPEILANPKYFPFFENCVGAIDGTHVDAHIEASKQVRYRGRKGFCSQNVMAVCSFDMKFTYVIGGWEGTANDSRILNECLARGDLDFPMPPEGKYYLVDSGYANQPGFLAPYRGQTYHLAEFRTGGNRVRRREELYNFKHSSLRNVIERCFGMLKMRFPILKRMPCYKFPTQVDIVVACCALHNFIRMHGQADVIFDGTSGESSGEGNEDDDGDDNHAPENVMPTRGAMNAVRDTIADLIWAER